MAKRVELVDVDKGFRALFTRAKEIKDAYAKVGVLADDGEGGGLHVPGGKLTVAEIAAVLEYGTEDGNIPSRSFVRSTFDDNREQLGTLGVKLITAVLDGKMPLLKAIDLMGMSLSSAIKNKITSGQGIPPPNAPSTIRRKLGFIGTAKTLGKALAQVGRAAAVRPLVDTGRLLNAITWASIIGGEETE